MKFLRLTAALALAAVCLWPTPPAARAADTHADAAHAFDKIYQHEEGGLQFELPDGWKAEPKGEMIEVSAPDDSFTMFFMVTEGDTLQTAADALDEELAKIVKNHKLEGEPKENKHNGMPHFSQTGSGEIEGVKFLMSVDILIAKKPVLILTLAAPGLFEKHADDATLLIKSIKPIE